MYISDRVESHSYMNRQLYLGTVFFACLLFLFPTVLTYYVVFTTVRFYDLKKISFINYIYFFLQLRLCINFVSHVLKTIRRQILEFPMEMLLNWSVGRFYDTGKNIFIFNKLINYLLFFFVVDSLQLDYVEHTPSPLLQKDTRMKMCVFKLSVNSSSLARVLSCHSGVLQELVANENSSIKTICQKILSGTF